MRAKNLLDRVTLLDWPGTQLLLCFSFDGMGMATYFIPGLGEIFDIVYAFVQGAFLYSMIGGEKGAKFFMMMGIAEELLPFTDFVPSCLISWLWKFWFSRRR